MYQVRTCYLFITLVAELLPVCTLTSKFTAVVVVCDLVMV